MNKIKPSSFSHVQLGVRDRETLRKLGKGEMLAMSNWDSELSISSYIRMLTSDESRFGVYYMIPTKIRPICEY